MSYHGSEYRPPLPPRSPRPQSEAVVGQTYASKYGPSQDFTPASGSGIAPPVPQRPPGFEISPSPSPGLVSPMTPSPGFGSPSPGGRGYMSFPPPPPSPNRTGLNAQPPLPPRPVSAQSHLNLPGGGSYPGYQFTPSPQSSPGAQSPFGLTSFPPPPPGGPPPRVSASPASYFPSASQAYQPSGSEQPARPNPADGRTSFSNKASLFPTKDPEIPESPPPAYTPSNATASHFSPVSTPSSLASPHPQPSSVSSPQSPNELSFFPAPPPPPPAQTQAVPPEAQIDELLQQLELGADNPASGGGTTISAAGVSSVASVGSVTSIGHTTQDIRQSEADSTTTAPPRPPKEPTAFIHQQAPTLQPSSNAPGPTHGTPPNPGYHIPQAGGSFAAELSGDLPNSSSVPSYFSAAPATHESSPLTSSVSSCIDSPLSFATTWYSHSSAPEFYICSYCYTTHILPSPFRDSFQGSLLSDGQPRHCRFSKPRMRDHLFKAAVASVSSSNPTGRLQPVLNWMRLRPAIADCRGINGVKGDVGIKWYKPRNPDDIPGFVVCQACHEDHVLTSSLSAFFEPTQLQGVDDVWACDLAIPYVEKEYKAKGSSRADNAWGQFAAEAKGRMGIPPCPGRKFGMSQGKRWFVPNEGIGPRDLVFCHACYCDLVIHSGQESKWREDVEASRKRGNEVRCSFGSKFNVRLTMARSEETKDYTVFWAAMNQIGAGREQPCEEKGIKDGVWYTLPSNPANFRICRACYLSTAASLKVSQFFVPQQNAAPGTTLKCCFNLAHPRLKNFMPKLLETYLTRDPKPLEDCANLYASMPSCPRDTPVTNRRWYGWPECSICPECYQDFARNYAVAAQMPLQNIPMSGAGTCDMYSPRMRSLYASSSPSGSAPDPQPLLTFAARRHQVYVETMPKIRSLMSQQRRSLADQSFLNALSSFHNVSGAMQGPSGFTYDAPGVGYGFRNMDDLQGAAYGQQAMSVMGGAQDRASAVASLERRWRQVE